MTTDIPRVPATGRGGRHSPDDARHAHFRATDYEYGVDPYVEVRYDETSGHPEQRTIDEIVTETLHLEMMSEDTCWMDVLGLHVWMRAVRVKGQRGLRLLVTCQPSDCEPVVVTPQEGP